MDYMSFETPYNFSNRVKRLLWNLTWSVFARPFPKSTCAGWKRFLLRLFGAKIANTAIVYAEAKVFMPWNLEMGDYACLASGVDCYNAAPVILGTNATVSQRAFLCTAGHDIELKKHPQKQSPIIISDRAWVAAEAFIGMGVKIGEGAVVGARAVVFKDVAPWTVVGGNPAQFIKKRVIKDDE